MAKRTRKSNTKASAISDRSGFRFPMDEMVVEPGTGYLVHKSESDGMYNLVDHPVNYPQRYSRYDDPKPTINGRTERTFEDAQNNWLGQGYSYLTFKMDTGFNSPLHIVYGSGSSNITLTASVNTFTPGFTSGSSSIVFTTSASTTAIKLGSGTSSIVFDAFADGIVVSSLSGSYSFAYSSAWDRSGGSTIEVFGSGSSNVVLNAVNTFSVLNSQTASGTSSIAMTTLVTVTIQSVLGASGWSTAYSPAYS